MTGTVAGTFLCLGLWLATPPPFALGSAVELRLTISFPKGDFKVGDEILVRFRLENLGAAYYLRHDDSCESSYHLSVTGTAGPDPPLITGAGFVNCADHDEFLPPGASFEKTLVLNRWVHIQAPGRYLVAGGYYPRGVPAARSEMVTLAVAGRSAKEMDVYVGNLLDRLHRPGSLTGADSEAAAEDRREALEKLMYTGDPRMIPAFIEAMYAEPYAGHPRALDDFIFYLADHRERVKGALLKAGRERGLAARMSVILGWLGATDEEMVPVIERSLAPDGRDTWLEGASAALACPGRLTSRLVAIARVRGSPARLQALTCLAWDRTEEGLAVLREALRDPDVVDRTAELIRNVYHLRRRHPECKGRPLLESDFEELLRPR